MLTTSYDRNNVSYVSTVEAIKYPILGTQWHPEKMTYEWNYAHHIPHSADAVRVTQVTANYLVDRSRYNKHAPYSVEEERRLLIYNYQPTFTEGQLEGFAHFDQTYFF